MATPKPVNNSDKPTTNALGVELPVRAVKTAERPVDRREQANRLKAKHSVAFEELSKR
ncbi:MAG: hypothetical protein V3U65_14640 [Granulosicoccaceae bacterium]